MNLARAKFWKRKTLTPEMRKRRRRRRFLFYGGLAIAVYAFWVWVPWEIDLFRRPLPNPNPPVPPEPTRLFGKGTRVMLVTAHPDDSEFYIGGLLTQLGRNGVEITQVICTHGDKAYYPFEDWKTNRRVREAEQRAASGSWHVSKLVFLDNPDGRLQDDSDVVHDLVDQMEVSKPEYVLCFDSDYPPRISHRDHRRAGSAAEKAFWSYGKATWLMRFSTTAPNYAVDITDDWEAKRALLRIHRSQFHGDRLARVEAMVGSSAEAAGDRIGVGLAEDFRCTRNPNLDERRPPSVDPVLGDGPGRQNALTPKPGPVGEKAP